MNFRPLLFFLVVLNIYAIQLRAQKDDTITISPLVGNVIDSAEKARHHLFPYYSSKIFIRAVFLRNPDSSITLRAHLKPDSIAEEIMSREDYVWTQGIIEETFGTLGPNQRNKPYDVVITLMNGETRRGILYHVKDSSVATSREEIPVSEIRAIRLVRQNKISRSIGNGLLVAAGVGMIMGIAHGGDTGFIAISGFGYGLIFGSLLALPGMLVGGIIGALPSGIRVNLDGMQSKYKRIQKNLKTYSCDM